MIGAGLRLCQFFANASLWIDEILAENVIRRPLAPLALDQVASPAGWLGATPPDWK